MSMPLKAETLFGSIQNALDKEDSWSNCVSFGVDNCNTVSSRDSIKTRIHEKNKNCFVAGCSCHLAHLAEGGGGGGLCVGFRIRYGRA